jgi:hypothetical protein
MRKDLPAWMWTTFAVVGAVILGLIDWATGYELNFFVFYFLPVSVAAWFVGRGASMSLAVLCAMVWFGADFLSGDTHSTAFYAVWNTMVRLVSFVIVGFSVSRTRHALDRERQVTADLRKSLSEVKVLESFLPICCQCKKIRNQEGHWQEMEVYIGEHAGSQFSHGYCPECAHNVMVEAGLIHEAGR